MSIGIGTDGYAFRVAGKEMSLDRRHQSGPTQRSEGAAGDDAMKQTLTFLSGLTMAIVCALLLSRCEGYQALELDGLPTVNSLTEKQSSGADTRSDENVDDGKGWKVNTMTLLK